jgi:hypothetical protein
MGAVPPVRAVLLQAITGCVVLELFGSFDEMWLLSCQVQLPVELSAAIVLLGSGGG